jgi:hypothetical protein
MIRRGTKGLVQPLASTVITLCLSIDRLFAAQRKKREERKKRSGGGLFIFTFFFFYCQIW